MRSTKLIPVMCLLAALALRSATATADMVRCKPPLGSVEFLVFLSEPIFKPPAFADQKEMEFFFNRLWRHLDERQDEEMAEMLREVDYRVARCEHRRPNIDGTDFDSTEVQILSGQKVVVEIWGSFEAKRAGDRIVNRKALINYLVVPIQREFLADNAKAKGKVRGIHGFDYPDGDIVATDFVDLVSNNDLRAFVSAAIGVEAFDRKKDDAADRMKDFALAHRMLCLASLKLLSTYKRLTATQKTKPQSEKIQELRTFVRELAKEARAEVPDLKEMHKNPDDPCSQGARK